MNKKKFIWFSLSILDENASLPKKRKMELIPTSKTSFKHSEHKPIKPENKKAKPNQLKLKAVKVCTLFDNCLN